MTYILFAAGTPAFFAEVVALLLASAVIAYLSYRIGLVPIIGFLIAGVVIGPGGFAIVQDIDLVNATAEIGVILLLFTIGIEFSLEKLSKIKKLIFIGGGIQVVMTIALVAGLLMFFGISWKAGIFTGFLIALSSTAIVLKLLGDKGETQSQPGQIGLGLLIFQDLAIILMVLLVPLLGVGGGTTTDILLALGKAAAVIMLTLLIARRLLPPVLEVVAKTCSPELFLLTIIAICFGTAYITSLAGVSLSLGAFLAGLMVSESRFSHHAFSEILPLQILFSATFFVSVGMLLDVSFLITNLPIILAVVAVVILLKILTTGVAAFSLGYKAPVVAASAILLAQVGEFSFVLEKVGREYQIYPAGLAEEGGQIFIASTVLLMIATPFMSQLGFSLQNKLKKKRSVKATANITEVPEPQELHLKNHVIIAGFGNSARKLGKILNGSGIPYVIITLSPAGANEAEKEGHLVLRGDASKLITLNHAGLEYAKLLVIADDDPAMAHHITAVARGFNPTVQIVVRTKYTSDIPSLKEAGVDRIIPDELEAVVQIINTILIDYKRPKDEIEEYLSEIRSGNYKILEKKEYRQETVLHCENIDESCLQSRNIILKEGMPVLEVPVKQLDLEKYNISISNIRRSGKDIPFTTDQYLSVGDEIEMTGAAESFAMVKPYFSTESENVKIENMPSFKQKIFFDPEAQVKPLENTNDAGCEHFALAKPVLPSAAGCEECLETGDMWVHLRICMTCGHVGCCDSSKNKHASKHFHRSDHPVVRSLEPGELWAWCYKDQIMIES